MQDEQNMTAEQETQPDPLNLNEGAPAVAASVAPAEPVARVPHRKVRTGVVVSDKMQKSIVVAVVRRVRHPLYKKYYNATRKFMAHDENDEARVGDTVRIIESRPLSAHKRWRLDVIVEKAK